MIVIHNFKEACSLHQQGHIPFRLLQEQALVLIGICPQPNRYINEALDITDKDIEWLLQQPDALEDYNGMLGGEVYICQCEADLKEVQGIDLEFAREHGNRWPDVTDQVMSWDVCNYLTEKDGEPNFCAFAIFWNDAGGNIFYLPKHLWGIGRVADHVLATQQFWD
jgi:hypothetical protein